MAHNRLDRLKKLMFSLLNYPQRRREDVKRRGACNWLYFLMDQ
jgi:hypothetical protein